jgi:hypothetical protein
MSGTITTLLTQRPLIKIRSHEALYVPEYPCQCRRGRGRVLKHESAKLGRLQVLRAELIASYS